MPSGSGSSARLAAASPSANRFRSEGFAGFGGWFPVGVTRSTSGTELVLFDCTHPFIATVVYYWILSGSNPEKFVVFCENFFKTVVSEQLLVQSMSIITAEKLQTTCFHFGCFDRTERGSGAAVKPSDSFDKPRNAGNAPARDASRSKPEPARIMRNNAVLFFYRFFPSNLTSKLYYF